MFISGQSKYLVSGIFNILLVVHIINYLFIYLYCLSVLIHLLFDLLYYKMKILQANVNRSRSNGDRRRAQDIYRNRKRVLKQLIRRAKVKA